MKHSKTIRLAAVAATLGLCASFGASANEPSEGERELAEILEGRVAGEPVNCLSDAESDRMQVIDDTAFVFRDGRTIYVNRPRGAEMLDDSDLPVFRQYSSQICRLDQVELRDRIGGIPGPVIVLEEFIPYTKTAGEHAGEGG
jgi:hypothetical protein